MHSAFRGAGPVFSRSHGGYQEVPVFLPGGDGGYARLPELKGHGGCGACPRLVACGALVVCLLIFLCPVGWLAAQDEAGAAPAAVSAAAVPTTSPPYDCYSGEYAWDRGWSHDRLKWCCEALGEGCDIKEVTEQRRGCNSTCEYGGQVYSCYARVQWAARNTFKHEPDPCSTGYRAVLQQCPSDCAHCRAERAGCHARSRMALQVSAPPDEAEAGLDDEQQQGKEDAAMFQGRNSALAAQASAPPDEAEGELAAHQDQGAEPKNAAMFQRRNKALAAEAARRHGSNAARAGPHQAVAPHTCAALSRAADPDWDCRDALPEDEGEPLESDAQRLGSVQEMKQWCEDDARCVGFAFGATPPGAGSFASFYPKRRGTGFAADRAKWSTAKHPGESWLFFYLRHRAAQETPAPDPAACGAVCELRGANGTCAEHVVRAAEQRFADEGAESCALAITSVMMHCPGCGACPLGGTGCQEALPRQANEAPATTTTRVGRLDDGAEDTTSSRAAGPRSTATPAAREGDEAASPASTTTESTATPDSATASTSKRAGRPSTRRVRGKAGEDTHEPGAGYDCLKDADGWTKGQKVWCCQNHGVGCRGLLVKILP